ncbi:Cell surface protein [Oopsacas minuta]|uniref:Cell surface protein n=1 Tax=Oopsacas minuta TaxID=111878 RepID=A0AAV7KJ45_9METZ|nr:Cell surface protein [Oopsacas minuta]
MTHKLIIKQEDPFEVIESNLQLKTHEIQEAFNDFHKILDSKLKSILVEINTLYNQQREKVEVKHNQIEELNSSKTMITDPSLRNILVQIDKQILELEQEIHVTKEPIINWNTNLLENAVNNIVDIYFPGEQSIARTLSTSSLELKPTPSQSVTKTNFKPIVRGYENGQVLSPSGLCIDRNTDQIFIADRGNDRVQVYKNSGEHIMFVKDKDLANPNRIAIDRKFLYVACAVNSYVIPPSRKINSHLAKIDKEDGEIQSILPLEGTMLRICTNPVLSASTRLFCASLSDSKLVQGYDSAFRLISSTLLQSPYYDQYTQIYDIRVHEHELFALYHNSRYPLQVFGADGKILRCVQLSHRLVNADFLCIDSFRSYIVISDGGSSQVKVFTFSGECIAVIGKDGEIPAEFEKPWGVDMDQYGNIFICDNKSKSAVHMFEGPF